MQFQPRLAARVLAATTLGSAGAPAFGGPVLLVLNKSEANVSFIEPDSGAVIATVPVGDGPHEAAVSPDGRTAVVCNYGQATPGNTLTVIDVPTRRAVRDIDLGDNERPHGVQFLPDGARIAVTTEGSRRLLIVDVARGHIDRAIDTGQDISHMVALTPDAKRAFVANIRSGSVSVLDVESGKRLKIIQTGAGAEGVAVHPMRHEAWITNRAEDSITVIDTNTLEPVATLECADFPIRVAFTPNGKHALVSNARSGDVAVFDAHTRQLVTRIAMTDAAVDEDEKSERLFGDQFGDSPVPVGILVRPDGERAFIANTNADTVTEIDLKNWKITRRLTAGKEPDGMAWADPH